MKTSTKEKKHEKFKRTTKIYAWYIPLSMQNTIARKADRAKGMPNHKLKKTGQI